jgi:predicted amidohydrolase YtcJ
MRSYLATFIVVAIVSTTVVAGLIVGAQRDDRNGPVDLIVFNGKVYPADGTDRMAEAVAVRGNQVLRVGSNSEIKRLARRATVMVDAHGGAVLPGFDDSHQHMISGGLELREADLSKATNVEQAQQAVRAFAAAHPASAWVIGSGWTYMAFPGGLPTRQQLDAVVSDRPAYMSAYDGHTAWVNSKALALAGITKATPDPEGGVIVKDPKTGEPTGTLKEAAKGLVSKALPKASRRDKLVAIREAMALAHRFGLTSVQLASGSLEDLELFDELRRAGQLKLRVYMALSVDDPLTEADADRLDAVWRRFPDDPLLKTGAIKLFIDGVIESHTAVMLAPYANAPTSGTPLWEPAAFDRVISMMDARGWQVWVHAIGDGGVRMTLDAYEKAAAANPAPARGRRHRIEHIETIDAADIPRFGKLGVIASQQPFHGTPDSLGVWIPAIGLERASRGWVYNSIRSAGGHIAFGSDWSVVSMDPRIEIHTAVNRTALDGKPAGGWLPEQRIQLKAAIDACTNGAAYASFDERRKGSLTPGMLADLVILSTDVFAAPPERFLDAHVTTTIFDGKVVYRAQ